MDSSKEKEIAEIESPKKQEIPKMDSPNKQEIAKMNSPNKQEIAEVNSPNKPETAEVNSPNKPETAEMDSLKKKEIAEIESPKEQDIAEVNSPNKPETAEMESSKTQETAEMDSPRKQEAANIDWNMRQMNMRQMKIEINATLEDMQRINDDLTLKITKLERENDSLNLKLDLRTIQMESREKIVETLMKQRDTFKNLALKHQKQKNDEQEQAQRILKNGIENFEQILVQAYKLDLDEKGVMQEKLQRLMDEIKDLKRKQVLKTCYVRETGATSSMISSMNSATLLPNGIVTNGEPADHYNTTFATNATRVSGSLGNGNDEYNQQQQSIPNSVKLPALKVLAEMMNSLNELEANLKLEEDRSSEE